MSKDNEPPKSASRPSHGPTLRFVLRNHSTGTVLRWEISLDAREGDIIAHVHEAYRTYRLQRGEASWTVDRRGIDKFKMIFGIELFTPPFRFLGLPLTVVAE